MRSNSFRTGAYSFALLFLFLIFQSSHLNAQGQTSVVKGIVQGANNVPLADVSVVIRNAKNNFTTGTTTDSAGVFTFSRVPSGGPYSFTFSRVEYEAQTLSGYNIKEGISLSLVVTMKESAASMTQVVVVGYNTQSKKDITGAVGTVNMKELKSLPTPSVGDAMQGKAAGVQIISSGAPGNNPEVRIRGISTIGNNTPLLVIDGVPTQSGLNQINMDDVESLQILKDASAAAIYGARGANGVIIITTKRGKGAATQLNFNAYYGIQSVARKLEMLNASEFAALHNDIMANGGLEKNPAFGNPDTLGQGTDWMGALLSPAPIQNYSLSFSANTPKTNYYVSANYMNQEGIVLNTSFKRYILQFNSDTKVFDNLKFGNSLTLNHDIKKSGEYNISNTLMALPTQTIYNADGTWAGPVGLAQWAGDVINPIGKATLVENSTLGYNLRGSLYGELTFLKNFRFRSSAAAEASFWNTRNWSPKYNWQPSPQTQSFLGQSSNKSINWVWDNTLTYDKTFGDHRITVLAGTSAQENRYDVISGSIQDFISDATQQLNNGSVQARLNGTANEWSLFSYFGRVNYAFKDKYLFTGTLRRDGSSRFGSNNKWGVFPSGSFAWRVSREDFFNVPFINDMKLRAGFGLTGNQEIGLYSFASTLDVRQYNFNNQFVTTVAPTFMPNPNIRWEAVAQQNIGLDVSLFKNRVNVVVDGYVKSTRDMLVPFRVPAISGFSDVVVPPVNAGKVRNRGIEITVNSTNTNKGPVNWNTSFNFSYNQNHLIELYDSIPMDVTSIGLNAYLSRFQEGYPINVFYGYVADGIFQTQKEVDESAVQVQGTSPFNGTAAGDIRFKDINNDGVIDEKDRQFLGNPNPRFIFGMTNTFEYKGLDLSIFLQGVEGNSIFNATRIGLEGMAVAQNQTKTTLNRWTGAGTGNTIPRAVFNDPNKNTRVSSRYIEDGSYLRLKNLTLGYTLPAPLMKRAKMQSARFYLSAQNLITFTRYSGIDPEVAGNGVDYNFYPITRTISFGVNLNF